MAAIWPTHRARRHMRTQRLRWEAKARKRARENAVRTKAKRDPKPPAEPISDWTWGRVHATSGRRS